jgi:hypothetical protein
MRKLLFLCLTLVLLLSFGTTAQAYPVVTLGTAADYAVLALDTATTFMGNDPTTVNGDYGLGKNTTAYLTKGTINGDLVKDPTATLGATGTIITGATVTTSMAQPVADALAASTAANQATNRPDITSLVGGQTYTANPGVNYVSLTNFVDNNAGNITLNGGANDWFIFNVTGDFDFASASILGTMATSHILWNILGTDPGDYVTLRNSGTFRGTVLAPERAIAADHLTINGALIGGVDSILNGNDKDSAGLSLHSEVIVNYDSFTPTPLPGAVLLLGAGMVRLVAYARRRKS